MQFTVHNKERGEDKVVECTYPIRLNLIVMAISLILGFLCLGLGLAEVSAVNFAKVENYFSGDFFLMVIFFTIAFDMLAQLWLLFVSLRKTGVEWLPLVGAILILVIALVIYFSNRPDNPYALIWVSVCLILGFVMVVLKNISWATKQAQKFSPELFYERKPLFAILSIIFDIFIFGIITVIMIYWIWFIIGYVLLCIIFRSEPTCLLIVIIVR